MPTTRKKVIKTVYKEDENSEEEGGDFSDSGSEAIISEISSSEDEELEPESSSGDEFRDTSKTNQASARKYPRKKPEFAKSFIKKIDKQINNESEKVVVPTFFSVKDLTEADKLLPPILNLSESDSSDDDTPNTTNNSKNNSTCLQPIEQNEDSNIEAKTEYKDVWSNNMQIQDNSEEIAKKTFRELEQHKSNIEETKAILQSYTLKIKEQDSDVKDLLAMGEEVLTHQVETITKKPKFKRKKDDSESEIEDWEEVKETKEIPQQGLQLFVEFPDAVSRKRKKIDVEMMMKRKINRVKKEYQIYMHKVHVLCWLGHGNYISRILNDQEVMAAAVSLVPSKECYPGERIDMKYVEQISTWYKDKFKLNQDKNEDKFKPKAPPLKEILLDSIKRKIVTTNKYLVFIFVAMLRALGLQCRVVFNFVTVPIKPPSTELCSLSTKPKDKNSSANKAKIIKSNAISKNDPSIEKNKESKSSTRKAKQKTQKIPQIDGNYDSFSSDDEMQVCWDDKFIFAKYENIMQVDGNDDTVSTRKTRYAKRTKADDTSGKLEEDVSPSKILKKTMGRNLPKPQIIPDGNKIVDSGTKKAQRGNKSVDTKEVCNQSDNRLKVNSSKSKDIPRTSKRIQKSKLETNDNGLSKTRDTGNIEKKTSKDGTLGSKEVSSKFFEETNSAPKYTRLSRKRSQTTNPTSSKGSNDVEEKKRIGKVKSRTESVPATNIEKSRYFENKKTVDKSKVDTSEDNQRVSHRELVKNKTTKKRNNDVTGDLVDIIKSRIKDAKSDTKTGIVKGKIKEESDEDSDYLPLEEPKRRNSEDDFVPKKIGPRPSTSSRRIDRRVISSSPDEDVKNKKTVDVWCEIFVEELEQWISVDVVKGKIHSIGNLYTNATHPVCYVVAWDNNNYLKDMTRKYVPHFNTVTRKVRVDPLWWDKSVRPYLGPKTARDKEEDEYLDRMQLEAPLPKSISEYKNHPLYALTRHLLKYEAIYPSDAAVLGYIRGEPVYARECVYVCRSRDTWLKEAKVVRLGEKPYKVVKARPKWDKLSNKLITDKPLEVFGPWQVQDYEPPVAENGIVPRNAYGNVELFKQCMLPKGTVHIKLPGLNRVARKLDIDCAPAMTGFDFNGGWSHPVYDGFVVCQEFEEIVTEAWVKDQEEQERRERVKTELRVYGNWKRLIKGLIIRERLKDKYGFEKPTTEKSKSKSKGPRLAIKKK